MMTIIVERAQIKKVWTLLLVPYLLSADLSKSSTQGDCSQKDAQHLPTEEQQVYQQLGPLYQKIYLYALNDKQRHRVVVYTCRGLNPFDAINVMLRAEERKYVKKPNDHVVPSDRTSPGCSESPL